MNNIGGPNRQAGGSGRGSCAKMGTLIAYAGTLVTLTASAFTEAPSLSERVSKGGLPALEHRLPENPKVIHLEKSQRKVGRYGGDLRLLMARSKDVRLMVVYGYARLIGYDEKFGLGPDILESIKAEANRIYTLHLRKGHKWSDGHPFTTEDFRYYWEDIAQNEELSPFGFNAALLVDGMPPKFEVIDETTVRFTWKQPNTYFLTALAGTRPLYIYAPSHYLRQFHKAYAQDAELLQAKVEKAGQRNWAALHNRMDSPYKNQIPNAPSLQPWINTTPGPSQRFVFERNPYFHRVDENGQQLPYVDRVVMHISASKLVPAKTGSGESDLQARSLKFSDFTFLKQNEKRNKLKVDLWQTTKGAHIALFPNLNVRDPVWQRLVRDVRFRRALSMAIDRHEINQVIYQGFATEGNNTVHEKSPLFKPAYRTKWATFDMHQANHLLDELGLKKRDRDGVRLLPDGRPMHIVIETAGESNEETDILELLHDTLIKVGIKVYTKPVQREVFRNRIFAGETLMSVWGGLENGVPNAQASPRELAPSSQQQLQWPKWGQHFQDNGNSGEPPDLAPVKELAELFRQWSSARTNPEQAAIWQRMLEIHADQVFSIGVIAGVPQPVVSSIRLQNVPTRGVYNWEPGAHFGIHRPDTFWFK